MKSTVPGIICWLWASLCPVLAQNNSASNSPLDTLLTVSVDSVVVIAPPKPRPSPMAVAIHKEESIYLKVTYCQPARKGRKVFEEIAPYGKLWRTGANEATEITLTREAKLGGKILRAGTYSLFSIPHADHWTILFNSELGQWGDYTYDKSKDVLTFDVPAQKNHERFEAFTIQFNETDEGVDMILLWDDVKVAVPFAYTR